MKVLIFLFTVAALTGCATDSQGRKENFGDTLKRWDDSMENTIDRLQTKSYD